MLLRSGRRVGVATQEEAGRATVSRRRCRARPDLLPGIPVDILHEILARLPAKSVLRCRAVCRLWRSLASDPAFLIDHHRRQPELALIKSYRTADGADEYPGIEALDIRVGEFRQLVGSVDVSCHGLFVVGKHICNPTTRQHLQWAPLSPNPKLHVSNIAGLFRHQPSGEYSVLYWRYANLPSDVYCPDEYRILTVGASESRHVDSSPLGWRGLHIHGAPVFLHGSLHLHSWSWGKYHRIAVFDTVPETFRYIRPQNVNPRHVMHLSDMGGKLAASTSKDGMTGMAIFVLQDPEHHVWAFQYRIKLPVIDIRRFQEQGDWWAKVVSEEGDVLVSCYGQLLHCDRRGNLVANFKYDDDLPVVLPHRLKESLIQHSFFQNMKENWFLSTLRDLIVPSKMQDWTTSVVAYS